MKKLLPAAAILLVILALGIFAFSRREPQAAQTAADAPAAAAAVSTLPIEPSAAPAPEPTAAPTPDPTAVPTPDPTAEPAPAMTAAPTPIPVQTACPADLADSLLYETLDDGTVMITGYTGSANDIVLPAEIGGRKVSAIGAYAFTESSYYYGRSVLGQSYDVSAAAPHRLTGVVLPDSVTGIGEYAFYGCSGLTGITIPNSVISIGDYAFCGCERLTGISIPGSVTSIGDDAFYYCTNLTSVTIAYGVSSIGHDAFALCTSLNVITVAHNSYAEQWCKDNGFTCAYTGGSAAPVQTAYPAGLTDSLLYGTLEDGTVMITGYTGSANDIVIPAEIGGKKVTAIGAYAFTEDILRYRREVPGAEDCETVPHTLTSVILPDSVTSIGEHAFWYCTGLTGIALPEGVTSIGAGAFRGCTGLARITIPESVTGIGRDTFRECRRLTGITLPDGITSIGDSAFRECTALTAITLPDSVTSIGEYAFYGCSGLTGISIPDGAASIGMPLLPAVPD